MCAKRKELWEQYVEKFRQKKQLRILSSKLPTGNPQLDPKCYETVTIFLSHFISQNLLNNSLLQVLLDLLTNDVKGFRELVKVWSPDLYHVEELIKFTLDKLYK